MNASVRDVAELPRASRAGALLEVNDLTVSIPTEGGLIEAVRGISFSLRAGETLGVVGESGSGKTMTSLAVIGLLPRAARVSGSILLEGRDLLKASPTTVERHTGSPCGNGLPGPDDGPEPDAQRGWQVAECLRLHGKMSRACGATASRRVARDGGASPAGPAGASVPARALGGMRQRVVIAIAIANEPDVLIADEPTTGLDVTVQAQILETLRSIRSETKSAMILITHDLGVVAGVADRVLVMYAGKAVEVGEVEEMFRSPKMPYTVGLLASLPSMDARRGTLTSIPGTPPSGTNYGPGCAFAPRCPVAEPQCETSAPTLVSLSDTHSASCLLVADAAATEKTRTKLPERLVWDAGAAGIERGTRLRPRRRGRRAGK